MERIIRVMRGIWLGQGMTGKHITFKHMDADGYGNRRKRNVK